MPKNNILSQIPIDLGDNLKLRFATPDDIDMLVEFNARLHEAVNAGPSVRDLMSGDHPTCKASDFTVVEDTKTGKIVSSACLISQIWTYGGIPFKFGQPEYVATEPDYRRRGLVRKQFEVIHALSAARGELMLGIRGIPWYYRLFGYEMALDEEAERVIDGIHIPQPCYSITCSQHSRAKSGIFELAVSHQPSAISKMSSLLNTDSTVGWVERIAPKCQSYQINPICSARSLCLAMLT